MMSRQRAAQAAHEVATIMSRDSIERNKRIRVIGILAVGAAAVVYLMLKAAFGR
jgi:hypothetical protein